MADITKFTGAAGGLAALASGLETVDAAAPAVTDGGIDLLKLDKDSGTWMHGQAASVVDPKSLWAVVPQTFAAGFIAWRGGKVEGEYMAGIGEAPVDPAALPPVQAKAGWEEQVGVALICIEGAAEGTRVIYKASNRGGIEAIGRLRGEVLKRAKAGRDDAVAVVQLGHSSYTHQEWGLVHKPVLAIHEWLKFDEFCADYAVELTNLTVSTTKEPAEAAKEVAPASRRGRVGADKADEAKAADAKVAKVEEAEVVSEATPASDAAPTAGRRRRNT
jgi:hypothetical protein